MIADLKPYPAMKDSGLPWLGEVPEHWRIQRGKNFLYSVDIRSQEGTEELLTVSSERGVIPRRTTVVTMFKAESYEGHKLCWPGDLVINSLWAWARGLGISQHHGIVSTAYGVYRPRTETDIDPQYLHLVVRSACFHWELQVRSKGVWTSRLQLTDQSFLGAPFPLPTLAEQTAIVRYLDHVDRRLRRLMRAKRKLIALLNEQKRAIIHRAVTRGLDPDVPLKDSAVEWLGEVPEHWDVAPIKRLLSNMDYGTSEAARADGSIRVLTMANIQEGEVVPAGSGGLYEVPEGLLIEHHDLLFTRTNGNPDLVGKVGIFRGSAADEVTFASYLERF